MKSEKQTILVSNRKASFEYYFLGSYEAGLQLTGTEIKSVRSGEANLGDAFCIFIDGELFVKNMHISPYKEGTYSNHEPKRERKLLLNKSELKKLQARIKEKGITIVPLKIYLNENSYAKLEIALAKGKKTYDKRESLKQKDDKREMDRSMKKNAR
ncbi:MAG: SsrA-binding protein SmpB [Bacteroidia bacterium]